MKYFAKIKYLGTNFSGFQVQPNARTVQGVLSTACNELLGEPAQVTGCSRTDAGVHANEFCLTIDCAAATIPPEKLPLAIARFLPRDISLYYAKECDSNFHPRYNAKGKEYLYRVKTNRISDPFEHGRVWFVPQNIEDDQIELMKKASEHLVGNHDFASFMSEGSDVIDTCRTVNYLTVEKHAEYVDIKICADGFLYNMVRIIVGTLMDVAFHKIDCGDIPLILKSKNRALAGRTAPPDGLYLNKVFY